MKCLGNYLTFLFCAAAWFSVRTLTAELKVKVTTDVVDMHLGFPRKVYDSFLNLPNVKKQRWLNASLYTQTDKN